MLLRTDINNYLLCSVSERLPVALTPDDVEHNPEFGKLLKALTQHVLPSGASVASEDDVREVSGILPFTCLCHFLGDLFVFICVYFVCFCFILHSCCIIVSAVGWRT